MQELRLNALRMNGRSKILSILMTKFNFFTEKVNVFDDHLVVSKLGSGCSTVVQQIKIRSKPVKCS
jgi:hypothetical protein